MPERLQPDADVSGGDPSTGSGTEVGSGVGDGPGAGVAGIRRRRRERRTDWRLGGRTVLHWREPLLAVALLSLGVAVLLGFGVVTVWPAAAAWTTLILWTGMLVPIAVGFARSRPIGLLRLRPVDLLFGLALGLGLRTLNGVARAAAGDTSFPTLPDGGGMPPWFDAGVAPILVAPVVEELFFHGILLVALFTVLRRPLGAFTAGLATWLATTAVFTLVHAAVGGLSVPGAVSTAALAAVCGLLVLLTGRIWAAVLTHAVYNATAVALALVATTGV